MAYHEIVIVSADESTDKLVLNPPANLPVWVEKGNKVRWSYTAPNVDGFYIENKDDKDKVFAWWDRPPRTFVKEGKAKVKDKADNYAEYNYSIIWKDLNGKPHTFDPKISVLPSKDNDFIKIALPLLIIGAGVLALTLLSSKKARRRAKLFKGFEL